MPLSKTTLIWIEPHTPAGVALAQKLQAEGCENVVLQAPARPSASQFAAWIESHLPALKPNPLIVCTQDLQWLDLFCTQLRQSSQLTLRFSPLVWIYERFDAELCDRVANIGVDELISASSASDECASRLRLRLQRAEALLHVQKSLDELIRRSAASETALQQREEFLGVCAHDLRSPVGLIQSSIGMLLTSSAAKSFDPLTRELLERAQRQSGHALRLINDLLDVMSFEQGLKPRYDLFSLDSFLKEFYADYKVQAEEKGIHFHYENTISDWQVLADRDRILQLLQNLLGNALKFTDSGKNVFLKVTPFVGRRKSDPPYPMVLISFQDEGKGIPQKEREKIFDRFSQIKDYSRVGGRGLGLTVAKQISNLHAGNLWVESEPGKGSTFHVLLPHVVSNEKSVAPNGQKKILVVEPTEAKKEKNFGDLQEGGFSLFFVRDGVEAVAMAFHLQPDVVLLRYDMHKMSEREVAHILRSHAVTQKAQIFMCLEEGESVARVQVEEKHLNGILPIPASRVELARVLRSETKARKAA